MTLGQLAILAAALFLVGSAEVVAGPLMTAMAPDFGVAPAAIAFLPAAYGLAYGGFAILAGPLSDRLGRKRPLQAGLLGFAALSAALPNAPDLAAAVALSALCGLCGAVIQPNALSLVADSASGREVDRLTARVFVGLMSAFVITPSIAGAVADRFGWRWAYYLLALLAALAFLAVTAAFRPGHAHAASGSLAATHRAALATPGVLRRLSASYFWLGWVAGFGVVVADVAARKLALSPTDAGLLAGFFGLVTIAGNLAGPSVRDALAERALPLACFTASAGVLAFALPAHSVVELALIGLPWAFGYGCGGPLHHARLSGMSARFRGTINSYHASLLNLGICSTSFLFGALAPLAPLGLFYALVGGVSLLGAVQLVLAARKDGYDEAQKRAAARVAASVSPASIQRNDGS
ncbi:MULTISPECIES: MFS transporter [Methylosinus]|uniref:MFS transporter n=1 Tax=Methylosinus trichosporium (strain ATCC 35070 / NCIMB 11131 / UNIQEM 75 / OB3b) TaxID=595536 RepID=A0A2D2D3S8_METT3|nr:MULTISPECIES: MFS transporter [Methylosinus]ATQ69661.1 MFS transporter [Methylosinus trichosporium OB3b]